MRRTLEVLEAVKEVATILHAVREAGFSAGLKAGEDLFSNSVTTEAGVMEIPPELLREVIAKIEQENTEK